MRGIVTSTVLLKLTLEFPKVVGDMWLMKFLFIYLPFVVQGGGVISFFFLFVGIHGVVSKLGNLDQGWTPRVTKLFW